MSKIQPAVKKETAKVALCTIVGLVIMLAAFGILHLAFPQRVPFDYRVILGGIGGSIVAVLNFFLMGLAVQKVAASTDEASARLLMKGSYSRRMLLQMLWVIAAIAAPCFQFVAGALPLLFPGIGIKIMGIIDNK